MKAAVLYEVNKPLVIEEIDIDGPGPGRVMVKTVSVGICGSDLQSIEGLTNHSRRPAAGSLADRPRG